MFTVRCWIYNENLSACAFHGLQKAVQNKWRLQNVIEIHWFPLSLWEKLSLLLISQIRYRKLGWIRTRFTFFLTSHPCILEYDRYIVPYWRLMQWPINPSPRKKFSDLFLFDKNIYMASEITLISGWTRTPLGWFRTAIENACIWLICHSPILPDILGVYSDILRFLKKWYKNIGKKLVSISWFFTEQDSCSTLHADHFNNILDGINLILEASQISQT